MSSISPSNGTRACAQCRRKKMRCDHPSTKARYSVSRVRSCIECRRHRAKCDRKRPCSSCTSSGVECLYTNAEIRVAHGAEIPEASAISPNESTDLRRPSTTVTETDSAHGFRRPIILLASDPLSADVTPLHPSIPQIWLLWHTYLEDVDPLYKIFHAPSFEKKLLHGVQDLQALNGDVETLLFAVYFAGIVSLTNDDCLDKFNEAKLVLLKR
jgi:hypothetical protein